MVGAAEGCGNVIFGNLLCVLCLPLFGDLNGAEHRHVLCAGEDSWGGAQQVGSQITGYGECRKNTGRTGVIVFTS